jgi:hypothetical protein
MSRTSGLRSHVLAIGLALCSVLGCVALSSAPALASLPDGRVYELVSPTTRNVYVPLSGPAFTSIFGEHGISTIRPAAVAPDGEAVVYAGEPSSTGGDGFYGAGEGNEFLATRSPGGGWTSTDLQVPNGEVQYQAFSSDLSVGILNTVPSAKPLTVGSPPEGYEDLYSHPTSGGAGGEYQPFYTGTPPNRGLFELGTVTARGFKRTIFEGYAGGNIGTSAVPPFSHLLFEANDALTSTAVGGSGEDPASLLPFAEEDNLYDTVGGRPYLVNVLPDGKPEDNASFGSFERNTEDLPDFSHVISADGSRVFWTALETVEVNGELEYRPKAVYVRENDASLDATTVQVDASVGGGGFFWTASTDGAKAFFTKGELYEYDINNGQTTDLTPGVEVLGVVGTSEDGEYVYYVDSSHRLNLWHDGASTFIATLSAEDGSGVLPFEEGAGEGHNGDWEAAVGSRTAEVTPDGRSLLFMSNQRLTGYDNEDKGKSLDEIFLYEAGTGDVRCVSCDPSGEAPVPTEFDSYVGGLGAYIPIRRERGPNYQPQVISEDGSRVFFDSGEPLVPQDTNGWLDVYEWERDGTGSCRQSQGCIYLLSGGTDSESSYLLDASANGDDVFIVSRAQLLPQDRGEDELVYDARVDGVQPPAESACSGTGCQGVPPASPMFATPSSVTFSGAGNFAPPASKPAVTPKSKRLTRVQKLAKALKLCTKESKRKRAACEKQARKRYAPAKKKGKR